MSKAHCNRCGTKVQGLEQRYNPYNVTFSYYVFDHSQKGHEDFFCIDCAIHYVKERNKRKGGCYEIRASLSGIPVDSLLLVC